MRKTVVHLPSFEGHFKTGLIFSLIEGMKTAETIQLICDQNPWELEMLLTEAQIPNLQWVASGAGAGLWSLTIEKGS